MSMRRRPSRHAPAGIVACVLAGLLSSSEAARASEYEAGQLMIERPWLRAPKAGETTGALFMVVHNRGSAQDRLVGVRSKVLRGAVVHADPKQIGARRGIAIPPHASLVLEPGRPFVSLDLRQDVGPVGSKIGLRLVFEDAGEVPVEATIEAPDARRANDAEAAEHWRKMQSAADSQASAGDATAAGESAEIFAPNSVRPAQ